MEKLINYCILMTMLFMLSACSIESENSSSNSEDTSVSLNDIINLNDVQIDLTADEEPFELNPEEIEGSQLQDLIPFNAEIITSVETPLVEWDFNGDGFLDVVAVLEDLESINDEAKNRTLLVALGTNDGLYHFPEYYDHIVLKSDQGGVSGDPFMGLVLNEDYNMVGIEHYGGSNYRWGYTYHISYIEKGWSIVAYSATSFNLNDQSAENMEVDLTMGEIYYEVVDEQGNSTYYYPTVDVKSEIELSQFNEEEFNVYVQDIIASVN